MPIQASEMDFFYDLRDHYDFSNLSLMIRIIESVVTATA